MLMWKRGGGASSLELHLESDYNSTIVFFYLKMEMVSKVWQQQGNENDGGLEYHFFFNSGIPN